MILRAILALLWAERQDWFLGVNLGVYYERDQPAIGPDTFLSLGVPRRRKVSGRLSYVMWQENNIVPQWVLEVVSKTLGSEYDDKMTKYAGIGVFTEIGEEPMQPLRQGDVCDLHHKVAEAVALCFIK